MSTAGASDHTVSSAGESASSWEIPNPRFGSFISSRNLPLAVPDRHWFKGLLWRAIYGWRYGYTHPDEDLLGVVDAVGDTLSVQAAAAKAMLRGRRRDEAQRIEQRLHQELAADLPDFSTLLGLEARLNALYPDAIARRRKWMLRERFNRVAAPAARNMPVFAQTVDAAPDPAPAQMIATAEAAVRDALARKNQTQAARETADIAYAAAKNARTAVNLPEQETTTDEAVAIAERDQRTATEAAAAAQRALDDAQRDCKRAEAQAAVEQARADLVDRDTRAVEARRTYEATMPGSSEHGAATDRLSSATQARESAQAALDKEVSALAALGGGTGGQRGSGGGSGGAGEGTSASGEFSEEQAEDQALLGYIHSNYLMTTAREKAIRDLKRWMLLRFWVFLAMMSGGLVLAYGVIKSFGLGNYWGVLLGLALITAVGRAGATTSIIRRIQDATSGNVLATDPIIELTALRTGKNDISLALLSSSVFALLLYAFFSTGVPEKLGFNGGAFPQIASSDHPAGAGGGGAVSAASVAASPAAGSLSPAAARPAATAPPPPTAAEKEADVLAARAQYFALRAAGNSAVIQAPAVGDATRKSLNSVDIAIEAQRGVIAAALQYFDRAEAAGGAHRREAIAFVHRENGRYEKLVQMHDRPGTAFRPPPSLTCDMGETCDPFPAIALALGLAGPADFFKMMLWAFISGFAERLVPDMLNRIVSRNQAAAAAGGTAPPATQSAPPPPH